jgi:hypothetical protein
MSERLQVFRFQLSPEALRISTVRVRKGFLLMEWVLLVSMTNTRNRLSVVKLKVFKFGGVSKIIKMLPTCIEQTPRNPVRPVAMLRGLHV